MIPALLQMAGRSRLEALLASGRVDPLVLAAALGTALVLGAAHALTPGHGKAIVAAYLAGSRGRIADAVYLGGIVTVTHTASVFVLGFATLFASERIAADRIFPWLSLASGGLIAILGAGLFWRRWRTRKGDHGHGHPHAHPHLHGTPAQEHPGRGSLVSLGVSGGLVPCPEALVVLLISISLRRLALGLAILFAFSLGLAAVLIGIGIAVVAATPLLGRRLGEARWMRTVPVASAAFVTVVGMALVVEAIGRI